MGKIGEHLFLELRPIASGNHGHFDHAEKVMQQRRHFGIERRFTFGECAIQIINNQLFHWLVPSGNAISIKLTARAAERSNFRPQPARAARRLYRRIIIAIVL